MKRNLLAGFMTLFGAGLALIGASFVWVATLGGPIGLWRTEHAYYHFVPHASPWTAPIGVVSVVVGLVLVIASLRRWAKRR
ncbi:MAG TPA: hypothetical protein VGD21_04075 [Lysobacter sp.]